MQQFSCEAQLLDETLGLIVVHGEVDLATCDRIREAVETLREQGIQRLVFDLMDVTFLDSSGVGVLVEEYRVLLKEQEGHQSLHIAATDPTVLRVLQLTGLDKVFLIHATQADALAAATTLKA